MKGKLLLIILDGWGIGKSNESNAIYLAKTPFYDSLWEQYPHSILAASGRAVGLLAGQIGSSEVGHLHIGAGRMVTQELAKIRHAIDSGDFYKNEFFLKICEIAKRNRGSLHLAGLLSDGGGHSHGDQLWALLMLAKRHGLSRIFVHAFLDGRDCPPNAALEYVSFFQAKMKRWIVGRIASLCGRYFAMDRDANWELIDRVADLLILGHGSAYASIKVALEASYRQGICDEYVEPVLLEPDGIIKSGDAVIFCNFRADRMRELLTRVKNRLANLSILTMTPYGVEFSAIESAFSQDLPSDHLSAVLAGAQVPELKVAESQKYAHVTYFFNSGVEAPYPGEARIMIPSLKVPSYDLAPEMSAPQITETVLTNLGSYPVIIVNYANGDMVGHSGKMGPAIQAAECIDRQLSRLVPAALASGYRIIVTADHGNLEQMVDEQTGLPHTAHTTNPVPLILIGEKFVSLKSTGALYNIAPTILELLDIDKPSAMVSSLLR